MLEPQQSPIFDNQTADEISRELLAVMQKRKSTRQYDATAEINEGLIKRAIAIAGTAPSGANKQPWHFALIADAPTKSRIRNFAQPEEAAFYQNPGHKRWHDDLKPLHTDADKQFLEDASYLIAVFYQPADDGAASQRTVNYYARESVGIATGFLLSALHMMGLATLTYTPSQPKYLPQLLGRPNNERTFMVVAVGLPSEGAQVPTLTKKTLNQISSIYRDIKGRYPDHDA